MLDKLQASSAKVSGQPGSASYFKIGNSLFLVDHSHYVESLFVAVFDFIQNDKENIIPAYVYVCDQMGVVLEKYLLVPILYLLGVISEQEMIMYLLDIEDEKDNEKYS